jgi:hypothetical protein
MASDWCIGSSSSKKAGSRLDSLLDKTSIKGGMSDVFLFRSSAYCSALFSFSGLQTEY